MGRCRCCWCWGASSSPHRRAATGPDGEEILPPLGAAAAGHGGACRPRALPWLFLLPSLLPSVCAKTRPNAWQCVGTGLHCRLRFQAVSERVTGVEPTLCLARLSAPVTSPPLHPPSPPYLAVRRGARGTDGLGG